METDISEGGNVAVYMVFEYMDLDLLALYRGYLTNRESVPPLIIKVLNLYCIGHSITLYCYYPTGIIFFYFVVENISVCLAERYSSAA